MSLQKKATNKIIKQLIENKIIYLITSDKIASVVMESLNNPFNSSFGIDHLIHSSYTRSLSSSLGTHLQACVVDIAKVHGWDIINHGDNDHNIKIDGHYSEETRNIINECMHYIGNTNLRDQLLEKETLKNFKEKILKSVISGEGTQKSLNSDLVMKKKQDINIIELKTGGDLDKGKAKSQREELFEIFALVASNFKKEISTKKININTYFATMYNKDSITEGVDIWKSTTVKKNFLPEEMLIGKDFWNFICEDINAYEEIIESFFSNSIIVEKQIKKMIKEIKSNIFERINSIDNLKIKENYLKKFNKQI